MSDFAVDGCLMGEMREKSDAQLLREYAERGCEPAFRELVMRHADFIYSAALRQVNSVDLAGDISQSVFTDLARKARPIVEKMPGEGSLAGWLHRSTRYAALNHLRDTHRRLANERQAMEQLLTDTESSPDWESIRPTLDEALDSLSDEDREALFLRYFKNHDFRVVGLALGVSDDTAQKRVSRALERLREFFAKRGVAVGASGLAIVISANAVQAAPIGLVQTISTAVFAGTTIATAATTTAAKAIIMTTLQKTLIAAALVAAVGTGIYQTIQASRLRDEVQTLQQLQKDQTLKSENEKEEAKRRLAGVLDENARLKSGRDLAELLKLRGEVGKLRQQSGLSHAQTNTPGKAIARLMDNTAAKELARVQIREALKSRYAPLVQKMNLSPEATESLYNLITENELTKKGMLAQLMSGDLDVNAALQARDNGKTELANQITALLGDAGYTQFDQFNHDTDAGELVKGLNRELGENALNDEQSRQIQKLFGAGPDIPIDDMDLFRSKESLDALFQQLIDRGHSDLQKAASFLTPEQLAAARTIQSNYFNTISRQMALGQQLLNSSAK